MLAPCSNYTANLCQLDFELLVSRGLVLAMCIFLLLSQIVLFFFFSGYTTMIHMGFVFMCVVVVLIVTQKPNINTNFIENLIRAPAYYPSPTRYPGFKWL